MGQWTSLGIMLSRQHSSNKRAIRTSTNQYSNLEHYNNVCYQLLTHAYYLLGYDEELDPQDAHKHGNASWLRTSITNLVKPMAKFDWALFEQEYPRSEAPREDVPIWEVVGTMENTLAGGGERLDTRDVEQALDLALDALS